MTNNLNTIQYATVLQPNGNSRRIQLPPRTGGVEPVNQFGVSEVNVDTQFNEKVIIASDPLPAIQNSLCLKESRYIAQNQTLVDIKNNLSNYIGFKSPDTLSASTIWTLPSADGAAGELLSTDGSGIISWVPGAAGDVVGPAVAVDDNVATFDGVTGKLIQDGGSPIPATGFGDVVGPAISVNDNVATFDGVTGKLIQDGGSPIPATGFGDVTAAANIVTNTLVTGDGGAKGIKDSTITVTNDDELGGVQMITLLQDSLNNTKYGYNSGLAFSTGLRSTVYGEGAGQALTTSNDNVAVGYNSLNLLTITGAGNKNVAVGSLSMALATGTDKCTAVGYNSMKSAVSADDCVAVGHEALGNIVGADNNVGVGSNAGSFLTANSNGNTCVGKGALSILVTGDELNYNTVVGCDAVRFGTSGDNNTVMGYRALSTVGGLPLNSSADNTIIGTHAADGMHTGLRNVAVGFESMMGVELGRNNNTYIGYQSGKGMRGGDFNIGLGSSAGSSNLSGDGNIHIDNVGADESNKIRIGTAQTNTFIKGIHGVTPAGATETVIIDANGELGTTASTLGDVTAAANMTNNTLLVGDGGAKGIKDSTITVTNDDELGAVQEVNLLQDSDNNTWYGYRAMNSKVGLTNSVAIGEDSMLNAPGITNCVAVGVETLQSSIDANDCVAIGYRAAFGNGATGGDGIIAIGSRALEDIDFGLMEYTIAIGTSAASNATRVSRCIFIGYENANDIVSGIGNISLGYRALRTPLADGSEDIDNNIAIGTQALENLSQAASGPTNNIAIGNLAGNSLTTDDSDNICVANPAFAGDSGVIRIGTNATHTSTFIQGIHNVTPAGATETVIIDANGELGSTAVSGSTTPAGYFSGFAQVNTSTSIMTFGKSGVSSLCRDVDDSFDLQWGTDTETVNTAVTGVGGITDSQNPVSANQAYQVYIVGDTTSSNSTDILAVEADTDITTVLEFTSSDYDVYRLIGWFRTQDGSTDIMPHVCYGNGIAREYIYTSARTDRTILFGGTATTYTDMASGGTGSEDYTCAGSSMMTCRIAYGTPASSNDKASFRMNGSSVADSASNYTISNGSALSVAERMEGQIQIGLNDTDRITEYLVSDAASELYVYVVSFRFSL
jgi:hypothetical protein